MTSELGERIAVGRTAEVYAWGLDRVVKVLRPGFPDRLGEAEAVAAELTGQAGIDAPAFHGTIRINGRFGLIYERREGPSMVDVLSARPWSLRRLAAAFAGLHAGMHASDGSGLPDFRPPLVRAVERGAASLPPGVRDATLRAIEALPGGTAILHGDMHPGNVVLTPTGPAVIDWMTASSGPPAADVARTLFLVRDSGLPQDMPAVRRRLIGLLRRRFASAYLAAYRRSLGLDAAQLRGWRLPILVARLDDDIEPELPVLRRLIAAELRGE